MVTGRQADEPVLTLVEAAGWLERRFGRRPNAATVWRWAIKGLRGVRLQTISLGRFRYTTERSLERFIVETSSQDESRRATDQAGNASATADARFSSSEVAAARRRREEAKQKAKEFLQQKLGTGRPRKAKRD